jgi:hypothetical protein
MLKEKGEEKVATSLIQECVGEGTSTIQARKKAWDADMRESLAAFKATNTASKLVEKLTKEEYNKVFKVVRAMKLGFTRQRQTQHGLSQELTEGNYMQKMSNMLALITNHFNKYKEHCTRSETKMTCVHTHLDELIK